MAIGLKRGIVELADHDPEWEVIAAETIQRLWHILGNVAVDIQHVGSTAIKNIKAKPVIDIAVAVINFDDVLALSPVLEEQGFICVGWESDGEVQPMYQCGEFVPGEKLPQILTHFIHIVIVGSQQWHDYINHRDYMNACPAAAGEYESLKLRLAEENSDNYQNYFLGKQDYIKETVNIARMWNNFGRRFVKVEPIDYVISCDKKYYIETADGKQFILRVSDVSEYDRKKAAFERMKRMDEAGIPMSRPVDFGVCNDGKSVYQLLTWCDGEKLEKVLPLLSETEQYTIGIKVGEIAKKIHSVTVDKSDIVKDDWNEQYSDFIDASIKDYHACGAHVDSEEVIFDYFNNNRHLLKDRQQCYIHGDYHPGNLMLSNERQLAVIDWEIHLFNCYGDPWAEICMPNTSHFSTGMLRGYFRGEPPEEYWRILALYISIGGISAITWAYYHHPELLESRKKYTADVLRWYDNMQTMIPSWYLKDFCVQWIDGIPYKLKAPFDFSFLSKYGKVFKVFDNQGSGNICFGMADGENKYFVKFAGAPTENYTGATENAVERLKRAVPAYQDLKHTNLINLIDAEEIGGGYAAVFDWVDAIHMWTPDGGHEFKKMPLEKHHKIFEDILDFHKHMAEKGYSALDFYEDHIMWDSKNGRAIICDIDFYSKGWYEGMSGIWNTDCEWYSPEQFIDGAAIDEISCVYVMGITAFALFGDSRDRCIEKWKLSRTMFDVAKKAVSEERNKRQKSIEQLIKEWEAAKT